MPQDAEAKNATKKKGRPENLKKPQTTEQAREWGRNGGIRSGEVRRERKAFKDIAEIILKMEVDSRTKTTMTKMGISEADGEMNYATAIMAAVIRRAKSGDMFAVREIRDIVGEKDSAAVGGVTIVDDI